MMLFAGPAIVVSLATIGQAILLPPSISSADADIINNLPYETNSQTLNLECLHCPVATLQPSTAEPYKVVWVDGIESKLQLNFDIRQGDVDILKLNGVQIYPPHDLPLEPLAALQITDDSESINSLGYLQLGYELGVTPVMKSERDQLELILIRFQIIEIGGKFVDGLESVELKLLKTTTGKLMIWGLETAPTTNPGGKNCNTLICKLRAILTDKLSHLKPSKGCGSKPGSNKSLPASWQPTHGHDDPQRGPHHHNKYQGFSRLLHAFKRIALRVFIPVFIGIAAGFIASLIGMFVGQSIIFLWHTFYRRCQRGSYSRVQQDETDIGKKDQEKLLLEPQDSPPVYEDVVLDKKSAE